MLDELHSARLLLRPFRMDDAEALFQLRSDPDQMHYLDREPMQTAGEAAEMIVREAYFRENYNFRGKFLDTAVYSLLSADFKYQDLSVS